MVTCRITRFRNDLGSLVDEAGRERVRSPPRRGETGVRPVEPRRAADRAVYGVVRREDTGLSTVAQRYGADGDHAEPGRVPGDPHPEQYGARDIGHDAWTGGGAADDVYGYGPDAGDPYGHPADGEEPPPISGAMVQQHRTLPHGELRADFGAHLETHYPRLVAQLYAITLNPQEAHDAVQDAYSRAWRRWSSLRADEPVPGTEDPVVGWVRRVAIRTSMRGRLLRRRRRPSAEETDPRTDRKSVV